jgi:hypothetical protein
MTMELTKEETDDLVRLAMTISRKFGIRPVDAYKVFVYVLTVEKWRLPVEQKQVSRCVK